MIAFLITVIYFYFQEPRTSDRKRKPVDYYGFVWRSDCGLSDWFGDTDSEEEDNNDDEVSNNFNFK